MATRPATIRRTRNDVVFDTINIIFMTLILFITIYPLYFVVIASVSDPNAVALGKVFFLPKGFSLESYANVFKEKRIWMGYRNTIFYTVFGTCLSMILTIPTAYALTKRTLPGRKLLNLFFLIPMYFGGGLIPTYLIMKKLHMINTWYSLIFIGAASGYNMIVTRSYFQSNVPEELYESARIDGAGELRTFFSIALPLVKPILAVMVLFFAVNQWNMYFNALVYVTKNEYIPLQMVLRSILLNSEAALANMDTASMNIESFKQATREAYMAQAMKYSLIVVASAPLLIAYPFVQKYFVVGMMVGAVKG